MTDVLGGVTDLSHQYIKFPDIVGEQANKKVQFASMSGLPNIIGTIDCTHVGHRVKMKLPSLIESTFIQSTSKSYVMQTWSSM